jgi:hypothetical protein
LLNDLAQFGVDLVLNGHEHTHSRSHFMVGTNMTVLEGEHHPQGIAMQQRPADFGRNRDERLIFADHPGAFIAPEGIPFITTGSISDFPKYTSINPMTPWTAWTDPARFDNYQNYSIMVVDGDSITIETWVVPYNSTNWLPVPDAQEIMTNSFTIRQTARFEDLELLPMTHGLHSKLK